jgi:3-dehydroquinate synthetase
MLLAFKFSVYLGYPNPDVNIIEEHLKAVNLPYNISSVVVSKDCDYFISLMGKDKKNIGQQITLILAYNIGNCFVAKDVTKEKLKKFLMKELNS